MFQVRLGREGLTQYPASAGPPQLELLAWILVQLMFFSAACLVVQFGGGPALFFSVCLLGGPIREWSSSLFSLSWLSSLGIVQIFFRRFARSNSCLVSCN